MIEIRTIVCPTDFTPLCWQAMKLASKLAEVFGARLILHHNIESRPPSYLGVSWMWAESHVDEAQKSEATVPEKLKSWLAELPESLEGEAKLTHGPLADSLRKVASLVSADLIVMATHGPSNSAHRSLTERVIAKAPCAVLTISENSSLRPEVSLHDVDAAHPLSILVPVKDRPGPQPAVQIAYELSKRVNTRVRILHVVRPAGSNAELDDEKDRLRGALGRIESLLPPDLLATASLELVIGEPSRCIFDATTEAGADIIIMEATKKSPLRRALFGDTTCGVLHGSDVPVWFIPSAFKTDRAGVGLAEAQ
jgi:nucleotide-binding universal stress UspA family protein